MKCYNDQPGRLYTVFWAVLKAVRCIFGHTEGCRRHSSKDIRTILKMCRVRSQKNQWEKVSPSGTRSNN